MASDSRSIADDSHWFSIAEQWQPKHTWTYLNHGSFGLPSRKVREVRSELLDRMDSNPMRYFVREAEQATLESRCVLAKELNTKPENLVPVTNATYGMNVVARSFQLQPGDQVLINNHEYGAVNRIWTRACAESGASLVEAKLPTTFQSTDQIIKPILDAITPQTKLLVVSHITSATATIFPVKQLCAEAHARGVAVCIDGPHAIVQLAVDLDELGCDFYTASCHKWLSAALGSGFLYVSPKYQSQVEAPNLSWGRLLPKMPETWDEQFIWRGTQDMTAFQTIPAAYEVINEVGQEMFRQRTHFLAKIAREKLLEMFGTEPTVPDSSDWYGSMTLVELPPGDWSRLQADLIEKYRIEIPVIHFEERWFIRVSCHLYTMQRDLEYLFEALDDLVRKN